MDLMGELSDEELRDVVRANTIWVREELNRYRQAQAREDYDRCVLIAFDVHLSAQSVGECTRILLERGITLPPWPYQQTANQLYDWAAEVVQIKVQDDDKQFLTALGIVDFG